MQINAVSQRQVPSECMGTARPLERKRVLVVEDNLLIGEALCEVLRDAGAGRQQRLLTLLLRLL
jgi:hypothetical protein